MYKRQCLKLEACGAVYSWSNWDLVVLVLMEERKQENTRKPPNQERETTTNSTHIWRWVVSFGHERWIILRFMDATLDEEAREGWSQSKVTPWERMTRRVQICELNLLFCAHPWKTPTFQATGFLSSLSRSKIWENIFFSCPLRMAFEFRFSKNEERGWDRGVYFFYLCPKS